MPSEKKRDEDEEGIAGDGEAILFLPVFLFILLCWCLFAPSLFMTPFLFLFSHSSTFHIPLCLLPYRGPCLIAILFATCPLIFLFILQHVTSPFFFLSNCVGLRVSLVASSPPFYPLFLAPTAALPSPSFLNLYGHFKC